MGELVVADAKTAKPQKNAPTYVGSAFRDYRIHMYGEIGIVRFLKERHKQVHLRLHQTRPAKKNMIPAGKHRSW